MLLAFALSTTPTDTTLTRISNGSAVTDAYLIVGIRRLVTRLARTSSTLLQTCNPSQVLKRVPNLDMAASIPHWSWQLRSEMGVLSVLARSPSLVAMFIEAGYEPLHVLRCVPDESTDTPAWKVTTESELSNHRGRHGQGLRYLLSGE